ncbi:hypothetical protein DFS34DRAFT_696920 [Phlyctochytrium arcticum]|nr:hypothetical protein DFS34DRAFT_696920 [Phlyctochytrium arcticum]
MSAPSPPADTLLNRLAARRPPSLSTGHSSAPNPDSESSPSDSDYSDYSDYEDDEGHHPDSTQMLVMLVPVVIPMLAKMLGRFVTITMMRKYFSLNWYST